jgi:hypothetical protein
MPWSIFCQATGDDSEPPGVTDLRIEGAGPEVPQRACLRQELA